MVNIFILAQKFRLSLTFMQENRVVFQIDFFTNAIEANSYHIAFYLLKNFEQQIFHDYQKPIEAHVKSY